MRRHVELWHHPHPSVSRKGHEGAEIGGGVGLARIVEGAGTSELRMRGETDGEGLSIAQMQVEDVHLMSSHRVDEPFDL